MKSSYMKFYIIMLILNSLCAFSSILHFLKEDYTLGFLVLIVNLIAICFHIMGIKNEREVIRK